MAEFALTLSANYNPTYISDNDETTASAQAALAAAISAGKAYWNIHSTSFGGGETHGYLVAVPEPSSLGLVGLGTVGMAADIWSKRGANKFSLVTNF